MSLNWSKKEKPVSKLWSTADRGGPAQPLLAVRGLVKHFPVRDPVWVRPRRAVHAVDGISFEVAKGETLGIVGESGCGKSTTARLIARLLPPDQGSLVFDGEGVAESVTTQVAKLEYIDAARMSGAKSLTIIRLQVLGNVLGPVFVYATGLISVCMILASGLSFLGLGVRPPEAEWGLMLNTLRAAIFNNPVVAALPGAMIFITSICFNLLADGIRSAMDLKR